MEDQQQKRLPRVVPVKNRQPAPTQITAEQILRESKALQADEFQPPAVKITDPEELAEYRMEKRRDFEDQVRRVGRWNGSIWVKYAQWEEGQKDFRRARSVWERALETDHRNVSLWLKYAEMEMRHRFVNHARNVWDRAVTLLPRIDQLWYKYIHMEEMLGNVAGARQIFERWMQWEPDHHGWMAYIKMELRYGEVVRARGIYERYVKCIPSVKAWIRFAKFEMKNGNPGFARERYEQAIEELGEDEMEDELFIKFAEFEEMLGETERARAIYKYALQYFGSQGDTSTIRARYMTFEKQRGDREGIEEAIFVKRREEYEAKLKDDPMNYDTWFDLTRLEEEAGDIERCRNAYEMAVAVVPPAMEKRYWQRYIYLWIKYALFEELIAQDIERCREVYRACLKLIPHNVFTFAKIWIMAAQFEIRQRRLDAARKIFGMAIGMCPTNKLFRSYIEMELALGNVDRCRKLYEKHLEFNPTYAAAWGQFAELETALGEAERARALYEIAISQPELDMPETLWKGYIDFEIAEGSRERARGLYERLLERTQHVKVWISYAKFEAMSLAVLSAEQEEELTEDERQKLDGEERNEQGVIVSKQERITNAREIYSKGYKSLRRLQIDAKEEAVLLLESWREFEKDAVAAGLASADAVSEVEKKMPRRVKRKRPILLEDGSQAGGMEEYYDYIFEDETSAAPNLKILEAAYRWKKQKQNTT